MTVTNSLCSPFIVRKFIFGHYIFGVQSLVKYIIVHISSTSDLERTYESYLLIKMGLFFKKKLKFLTLILYEKV